MLNISSFLTGISCKFGSGPHWDHWPFGPGHGDFVASAARFAFVALILGFIIIFLRVLFGPKGIFRDHEMDREAEEKRKADLEQLEKDFEAGNITELQYKYLKRKILD